MISEVRVEDGKCGWSHVSMSCQMDFDLLLDGNDSGLMFDEMRLPRSSKEYIPVTLPLLPGCMGRGVTYYFRKLENQLFDDDCNYDKLIEIELKLTELYEWMRCEYDILKLRYESGTFGNPLSAPAVLKLMCLRYMQEQLAPTFVTASSLSSNGHTLTVSKRMASSNAQVRSMPQSILPFSHINTVRQKFETSYGFMPSHLSRVAREALIVYANDLSRNIREIEEYTDWFYNEFDGSLAKVDESIVDEMDCDLTELMNMIEYLNDEKGYLIHDKYYDKQGFLLKSIVDRSDSLSTIRNYTSMRVYDEANKKYLYTKFKDGHILSTN